MEHRDREGNIIIYHYAQVKKWWGWKILTEHDSWGSIPVIFYGEKGKHHAEEYLKTYEQYPKISFKETECCNGDCNQGRTCPKRL